MTHIENDAHREAYDELSLLVVKIQIAIEKNPQDEDAIIDSHLAELPTYKQAAILQLIHLRSRNNMAKNNGADIEITPDKVVGKNLSQEGATEVLKSRGVIKTSNGASASGDVKGTQMASVAKALANGQEPTKGVWAKVKEELATQPIKVIGYVIGVVAVFVLTFYVIPSYLGPPSTATSSQAPSATTPAAVAPSASVPNLAVSTAIPAPTLSGSAAIPATHR